MDRSFIVYEHHSTSTQSTYATYACHAHLTTMMSTRRTVQVIEPSQWLLPECGMLFRLLFALRLHCRNSAATWRRHCSSHPCWIYNVFGKWSSGGCFGIKCISIGCCRTVPAWTLMTSLTQVTKYVSVLSSCKLEFIHWLSFIRISISFD